MQALRYETQGHCQYSSEWELVDTGCQWKKGSHHLALESQMLSRVPNPLLERPLPRWARWILVLFIALIPTVYVAKQYEKRHDLTQLILFGRYFESRELPEVRKLHPAVESQGGYDGQFYAQMALDPTLRRPELKIAIDAPPFREQRIVLPLLAFILGCGQPSASLFAYALLNLVFWYILLGALVVWMKARSARDFLTISATTLTSGALVSIQRSLTDLPSATFGTVALMIGELSSVLLIATAILTKPTSGLFLLRYATLPWPVDMSGWIRRAGCVFAALLPPILWFLYLHHIYAPNRAPSVWPFDVPGRGLIDRAGIFCRRSGRRA